MKKDVDNGKKNRIQCEKRNKKTGQQTETMEKMDSRKEEKHVAKTVETKTKETRKEKGTTCLFPERKQAIEWHS